MHGTMIFAVFSELCSAKTTSQGAPLLFLGWGGGGGGGGRGRGRGGGGWVGAWV